MKSVILSLTLFASVNFAAPTDYTPPGGWESVDYPDDAGANLPYYPPGTGENLPSYPPDTGENLPSYPPGTGEGADEHPVTPPSYDDGTVGLPACQEGPFDFTSFYKVQATPDQVVNGTTPTGGLPGASGVYALGLNSEKNYICFDIRLINYRGGFSSPALTATHIHEAARGQSGPPRIAFPNPVLEGNDYVSRGCLTGPFKTGLPDTANGLADSGDGFSVAEIEANPAGFFADVHSGDAVPGAVRGQIA